MVDKRGDSSSSSTFAEFLTDVAEADTWKLVKFNTS